MHDLICPRTQQPLSPLKVGGVLIFFNEQFGGVFFPQNVLKDFQYHTEKRGKALAKHLQNIPVKTIDLKARLDCPSCSNVVMMRRFFSLLHEVEIDECPSCGGIWLDGGELSQIHALKLSRAEREMLTQAKMNEFRIPEIKGVPHIHDNWSNRRSILLDVFEFISSL